MDMPNPGKAVQFNDYVNASLIKAREILHRYNIGCLVVSDGIHVLQIAEILVRGNADDDPNRDTTGALKFRRQIDDDRRKAGKPGQLADAVVVIFGPISDNMSGCCVETGDSPDSTYPYWFATVHVGVVSPTTMLHEILHCANAQHYMARPNLADPNYEDPFDIMVVPMSGSQQDMRKNIGSVSLAKLKDAYFYHGGYTPKQNQSR